MDGISKLFLGLRESKAALEAAFYRCLDSSVIRSGLQNGPPFRIWALVGEGRHFQCFKLPGRGGMDLAVNLARPAFRDDSPSQRREWVADLKRVAALNHPLVPPMEVLEGPDFFAYVQPYCESALELTPPLREALADLEKALAGLRLDLDDYPQLRRCQGHPFVIDFSDLTRRASGFRF